MKKIITLMFMIVAVATTTFAQTPYVVGQTYSIYGDVLVFKGYNPNTGGEMWDKHVEINKSTTTTDNSTSNTNCNTNLANSNAQWQGYMAAELTKTSNNTGQMVQLQQTANAQDAAYYKSSLKKQNWQIVGAFAGPVIGALAEKYIPDPVYNKIVYVGGYANTNNNWNTGWNNNNQWNNNGWNNNQWCNNNNGWNNNNWNTGTTWNHTNNNGWNNTGWNNNSNQPYVQQTDWLPVNTNTSGQTPPIIIQPTGTTWNNFANTNTGNQFSNRFSSGNNLNTSWNQFRRF